jgi:hypothetical protein
LRGQHDLPSKVRRRCSSLHLLAPRMARRDCGR